MKERQPRLCRQRRKAGVIADDERRVGLEFRRQQRVETMRFLRDHDGEALTVVGLGEVNFDFHAELLREPAQTGSQGGSLAIAGALGSLQRHAELAAGDLSFQRLDVGLLLKKKVSQRGR